MLVPRLTRRIPGQDGSWISPWREILLACAVLLVACESYHAKPLDKKDIEVRLTIPSAQVLSRQASQLDHPLLQRIELKTSDGISPREASVLAVLLNADLRTLRTERSLASAQLVQAGILPNPKLAFQLDKPVAGTTAGTSEAFSAGLAWTLNGLLTRGAKVSAATYTTQSVDLEISWKEWQTAQAARMATITAIVLQRQMKIAQAVTERLSSNLELTRKAAAQQLVGVLDTSAAEAAWNAGRARSLALKRLFRDQINELKHLLGFPPTAKLKLQDTTKLPSKFHVPSYEKLVHGLEDRRLDILALHLAYESQEASVRAAILGQYPQIEVGLLHARDNSNLYTTGLGISIDLPIFDRNQGQIAVERATRERIYNEYVGRIARARANIAALRDRIQVIQEQIRVAEGSLPGLSQLVDAYRIAAAGGQADVLSYYRAWNAMNETQIALLTMKNDLATARTGLAIESGYFDNLD